MKKKFVVTLSIEFDGEQTKKRVKALIEEAMDNYPEGLAIAKHLTWSKVRVRTVDVD